MPRDNRPEAVAGEMASLRQLANDLIKLADQVQLSYEELYDTSLSTGSPNTEDGLPPGRSDFRPTDPTGDVATSGMHRRMRWRARQVARLLRRMRPMLEEAEDIIVTAFSEAFDPEFREKLRRLREIENAIDG